MIRWLISKLFGVFGIGWKNDAGDVSPRCVCSHSFDEHYGTEQQPPSPCHHAGCDCTNYRPVLT